MCHIMPIMMNICVRVSGGSDFMESTSEYMEVWNRDEVVFSHFRVWCKEGLFVASLRRWDFMKRLNVIFMGRCIWAFMDWRLVSELRDWHMGWK